MKRLIFSNLSRMASYLFLYLSPFSVFGEKESPFSPEPVTVDRRMTSQPKWASGPPGLRKGYFWATMMPSPKRSGGVADLTGMLKKRKEKGVGGGESPFFGEGCMSRTRPNRPGHAEQMLLL